MYVYITVSVLNAQLGWVLVKRFGFALHSEAYAA